MIEVDVRFRRLMDEFDRMGITFKSRKQREAVGRMVRVLQNNVRLWDNIGLTNQELKEQGYSVAKASSQGKGPAQTKKIGRNDP